ncbi:MAG: DUF2169 domain-containing protein, partial [Byssovorax sp.]
PRLTTQLPAIRPQVFRIDPRTGRSEEIILRCDTLWIDTDRGVAVLTFRGLYDVGAGGEETIGKLLIAADPQGKKLRFERVEQMLREQSPGSLGPSRPSSATAPENDPLGLRYDTVKASRPAPAPTPPPAPIPIVTPEAKVEPTEAHHDRTRDISQMPRRRAPLPFQGPDRDSSLELSDIVAFISAPTELAPREIPIDLPVQAPIEAPAPPAAKPVIPSAPASTPQREAAAIEADPAPETVSIELYAAVSAALSRKGVDRGAVLRAHNLSITGWGAIDRHWKRSLAEHAERGEKTMLHAFDLAYVTAQGELHRPIGVREYGRILVGLERGEVDRVLADLELQLSDLMRIQRVWSKRVADSTELASALAVLLEELRKS